MLFRNREACDVLLYSSIPGLHKGTAPRAACSAAPVRIFYVPSEYAHRSSCCRTKTSLYTVNRRGRVESQVRGTRSCCSPRSTGLAVRLCDWGLVRAFSIASALFVADSSTSSSRKGTSERSPASLYWMENRLVRLSLNLRKAHRISFHCIKAVWTQSQPRTTAPLSSTDKVD